MMKLPPAGTRGFAPPKIAQSIFRALTGFSHLVQRTMGDRMKVQGQRLLMLTTVGAKTGKRRQAGLARFTDPDHQGSWLIVGSNAGAARHPGWCHNIVAHPDQVWITIAGVTSQVRPELLTPDERDKAWQMVVSLAPGYRRYETTTDRQIPIFRLTPTK
jgi:deazaflavin-dependent oxidoreductase (nitroreductase family)